MIVEFHETGTDDTIKLEQGIKNSDDLTPIPPINAKPLEMRLVF